MRRVITVPGAAFGSESEGFLARLVLCGSRDVEEGVRRIKKVRLGLVLCSTRFYRMYKINLVNPEKICKSCQIQ